VRQQLNDLVIDRIEFLISHARQGYRTRLRLHVQCTRSLWISLSVAWAPVSVPCLNHGGRGHPGQRGRPVRVRGPARDGDTGRRVTSAGGRSWPTTGTLDAGELGHHSLLGCERRGCRRWTEEHLERADWSQGPAHLCCDPPCAEQPSVWFRSLIPVLVISRSWTRTAPVPSAWSGRSLSTAR
jgi:hypothetical protein